MLQYTMKFAYVITYFSTLIDKSMERDAYINPNISGSRRDALANYIFGSSISGLGNSPTETMSD